MLVDSNIHVVAPRAQWGNYPFTPLDGAAEEFTDDQQTTPEELAAVMDAAGVDQALLIASRFHGFDNSYCADAAARYPKRFAGIANIDVFDPGAPERMQYWLHERGLRGLRFWGGGRGEAVWFGDEAYDDVWKEVCRLHVPCNAQTTTPRAFPATRRFLERFEGVKVTVNNLGHVSASAGMGSDGACALLDLARFPDVHVNVSVDFLAAATAGTPTRALLDGLLDRFGPSRLMWSAFYPSNQDRPYLESVALAQASLAFLTDDERDLILGGTARSLYPSLQEVPAEGDAA